MARTKNVAAPDTLQRQLQILRHIPAAPRTVTAKNIHDALDDPQAVDRRAIERDLTTLESRFFLTCDDSTRPYQRSWPKGATPISIPGLTSRQALAFTLVEQHLKVLLPDRSAMNLHRILRWRNNTSQNCRTNPPPNPGRIRSGRCLLPRQCCRR